MEIDPKTFWLVVSGILFALPLGWMVLIHFGWLSLPGEME